MTDNEILVLRPIYQMKDYEAIAARLDINEQLKHSKVITIPFGWKVVATPADTKIEVAEEPEDNTMEWIPIHPLQNNDGGAYACSKCHSGDYGCENDKFCRWCGRKAVSEWQK